MHVPKKDGTFVSYCVPWSPQYLMPQAEKELIHIIQRMTQVIWSHRKRWKHVPCCYDARCSNMMINRPGEQAINITINI